MRHIVAPPVFTGQPLDELKQWLAISGAREDALLADLLASAAVLCERFTGVFPLHATVAERLPASCEWQVLASQPVVSVNRVTALADDFTRRDLAAGEFSLQLAPGAAVLLRLIEPIAETQLEVELVAGLAQDWASLDHGLRQGVVRLAAHHYRERDAAVSGAPPAAVAALWRPWRRPRL